MSVKQDLMASLMGGGGCGGGVFEGEPESDLFGDIPIVSSPPPPPPPTSALAAKTASNLMVPASSVSGIPSSSSAAAGLEDDPLSASFVAGAASPPAMASNHTHAAAKAGTVASAPSSAPPAVGPSFQLMQSGLLLSGSPPGSGGAAPAVPPSSSSSSSLPGDLFASVDQEEQEAAAAAARREQEQQEEQKQLESQMQSVYLGNGPTPQQPRQQPQQQQYPYGQAQQQQHHHHPQQGMTHQQQPQQQQPSFYNRPPGPSGTPTRIPSQPGYLTSMAPQEPPQQQPSADMMDTFYRSHPPQQHQPSSSSMMHQQQLQTHSSMPSSQAGMNQNTSNPRYYHPSQTPSAFAGMHNPSGRAMGQPPRLTILQPPPVPTVYEKVFVTEPLLVAPARGLLGSLTGQATPHWSYQITTQFKPSNAAAPSNQPPPFWVVRRRFRHVVALEDRLHDEIPGAILPPRPDKHATRALEEASTHQSAEFALQRAAELQVYLNQLVRHPYAHSTHTLRLFLSLQDDVGTAWPEVSSNALTRLANVSVGAAVKISETTQSTKFPWQGDFLDDYGEDNAELLALANQEQARMAAVLQAVPKLEGSITLLREGAERLGSTGMELSRLAKEVNMASDTALGQPMEIVSAGMLRSGRRNKRLALELFAALHSYSQHYKSCRYEKMAFYDRRLAMMRRNKEQARGGNLQQQYYQQQQQQLYQQQQQQQQNPYRGGPFQPQPPNPYQPPQHQQLQHHDARRECDEIGQRLRSEINRLAFQRRTDWFAAVKVVASSYKEAATENQAIWHAVKESFLQAFPQYDDEDNEQRRQS